LVYFARDFLLNRFMFHSPAAALRGGQAWRRLQPTPAWPRDRPSVRHGGYAAPLCY
jgi:hypothetical protein